MKNPIKAVADLVAGALAGRQAVGDALGELTRGIGKENASIAEYASLWCPKPEMLANLDAEIAAGAARERERLAQAVLAALSGGVIMGPRADVEGIRGPDLSQAFPGEITFDQLCLFVPDSVRASLAGIIDGARFKEGPTMKSRPGLIAEARARIADLEAQHARLVDELAAAGIAVEHLPGERARRFQAERRRREAEAFNSLNAPSIRRGHVAAMPVEDK